VLEIKENKALCLVIYSFPSDIESRVTNAGRRVKIRLDRFKPTNTGYSLIKE
jgi:hypothetical protein